MADELIDIYDCDMNQLGTAMKSQAHNEGLWHKSFHCWIVKPSNDGKHKVWLQLRGKDKAFFPNVLDISAAGHLAAGEEAKDGVREIEEEIGLKAEKDQLVKMFTHTQTIDSNSIMEREFNPTYVMATDFAIENLKMQPEEVDGVYEALIDDLIELTNGEKKQINLFGIRRNADNSQTKENIVADYQKLAPRGENFYNKTLDALKRFCDGLIK